MSAPQPLEMPVMQVSSASRRWRSAEALLLPPPLAVAVAPAATAGAACWMLVVSCFGCRAFGCALLDLSVQGRRCGRTLLLGGTIVCRSRQRLCDTMLVWKAPKISDAHSRGGATRHPITLSVNNVCVTAQEHRPKCEAALVEWSPSVRECHRGSEPCLEVGDQSVQRLTSGGSVAAPGSREADKSRAERRPVCSSSMLEFHVSSSGRCWEDQQAAMHHVSGQPCCVCVDPNEST